MLQFLFILVSFQSCFACTEELAQDATVALARAVLEHPALSLKKEEPEAVIHGLVESGYLDKDHLCLGFTNKIQWNTAGLSFEAKSIPATASCTEVTLKSEPWMILAALLDNMCQNRIPQLLNIARQRDSRSLLRLSSQWAIKHCTASFCTLSPLEKVPSPGFEESPEDLARRLLLLLILADRVPETVSLDTVTALLDLNPGYDRLHRFFSKRPDLLESLIPAVIEGYGPHLMLLTDLLTDFWEREPVLKALHEVLIHREEGHFRQLSLQVIRFFSQKTGHTYTGDDRVYREWFTKRIKAIR